MKLGLITTSYPRFAGDPAGNFVAEHVRGLRALGHDVTVIAVGAPTDDGTIRVPSELFYDGGAPDRIERSLARTGSAVQFARSAARMAVAAVSVTARLSTAIARHGRRWDAIVAHWLVPSAVAALPFDRPTLAIAHGGDLHTLRALGLLGPTLRALVARRTRLAFVSHELLALARAAIPALAAIVQPMGIDLARMRAIPRTPTRPPTVLVVSRLVPVKGVDVALAAFAHVATPARLVIAGDGPQRSALARRAGPNVELVGAVDTIARDHWLAQASVVVVPSRILPSGRTEGMPLIALEALAAGVPVIASEVGGLRELAGICRVPPDDPPALARAIDRVLHDPPAATDLQAAVSHLDWPAVARRLLPM